MQPPALGGRSALISRLRAHHASEPELYLVGGSTRCRLRSKQYLASHPPIQCPKHAKGSERREQPEQGTNISCGWGWSRTLWTWRP